MNEAAVSAPRVVLATRNAHKVVEVRRILAEHGVDVDLVGTDAREGEDAAEEELRVLNDARILFPPITGGHGNDQTVQRSALNGAQTAEAASKRIEIFRGKWCRGHGP